MLATLSFELRQGLPIHLASSYSYKDNYPQIEYNKLEDIINMDTSNFETEVVYNIKYGWLVDLVYTIRITFTICIK